MKLFHLEYIFIYLEYNFLAKPAPIHPHPTSDMFSKFVSNLQNTGLQNSPSCKIFSNA